MLPPPFRASRQFPRPPKTSRRPTPCGQNQPRAPHGPRLPPKHAASGAGPADSAAPGRPRSFGGHAPPVGAAAPVTLRVPTPRAGAARPRASWRDSANAGLAAGPPSAPQNRRDSRQDPEDPQIIHLQFEVTEDPTSGGHANHDSHNAAGKSHVPKCTAPRAGAVGLDSLRGRRAPRAGAVGPGRLRWGVAGVAGHDWPSQGRGPAWDRPGAGSGSEMIRAGGGLQPRGLQPLSRPAFPGFSSLQAATEDPWFPEEVSKRSIRLL